LAITLQLRVFLPLPHCYTVYGYVRRVWRPWR